MSHRAVLVGITVSATFSGLFVLMALLGSHHFPSAQAIVDTPTATAGPTPTPKPNGAGPVGGLADLNAGPGTYQCIAWTDSDSASLQVKSAVQCYNFTDTSLGSPEPACSAQHSAVGLPTPVVPGEGNCAGHSGPPPYSPLPPAKATGTYTAADGGTVSIVVCFEDIGGTQGPNLIARVSYTGADVFQAAADDTVLLTSIDRWPGSTNAECTAAQTSGTVPGDSPENLPLSITKRAVTRDFDGDGCTDKDELLAHKGSAVTCGDDPWNPFDANGASPDVSGSYDILARAAREDVGAPGSYFQCKADIQQVLKTLTARALCYVDDPAVVVNPQIAGKSETGAQCYNAADDDADGTVNDGCSALPAVDPESGAQCGNLLDDDNDGVVDDGCSYPGAATPNPETGAQCFNSADDDSDGFVNDGCPAVGDAESACSNALDDDNDGAVNDGCPRAAHGESGSQCENGVDDDADGVINDGCVYPAATGALHVSCPPADAKYCGDGVPGSAPPGCTGNAGTGPCAPMAGQGSGCPTLPCNVSQHQFADIDTRHAVLMGTVDNTSNTINLNGCFPDEDGNGALGSVVVQAKIHAHTGAGLGVIYFAQTASACNGLDDIYGTADDGTVPVGAGAGVQIYAVRQAPGGKTLCTPNITVGYTGCRDSDGDGCPDKRELEDTQGTGGLRDPLDRWDYFNPEKIGTPHQQTVADIIMVVNKYGKHQGNAQYSIDTDRSALIGGNAWNLGPADGQQTVADILAAVKQYQHNC